MKTFNEKDLITWSNHDKAIIGEHVRTSGAVEYLRDLLEVQYNIRPLSRNENGDVICYKCGRVAKDHCYTEAGLREVEISGLCEQCYDKIIMELED